MPRPYSEDLRIRMIAAVEAGASRRSVAAQYDVGVSTVIRLMQLWNRTQSCRPGRMGGVKPYTLDAHAALVDRLLAERCDMTLEEMRLALSAEGVTVSLTGVDRYLKSRGITRKKRQRTPPSRSARTSPRHAGSGARNSQA